MNNKQSYHKWFSSLIGELLSQITPRVLHQQLKTTSKSVVEKLFLIKTEFFIYLTLK